jgi:AcrR family transcriptional regulator
MARYTEKQKAALDALMKDDVYQHAMMIITDEGLGSLTMERLANEVGVSRGTIYNYFDDREAVLDYVEERTFGPVLAAVKEVAASNLQPEEKLTKISEWVFTAVYEDRALVVALTPNKYSGASRECQMRRQTSALEAVKAVVNEGVATGAFRNLSPRLVSEIFFGAVTGMIESMAFNGEFEPAEKIVPTMMEIILGGLQNTGQPSA